jgi:molybdopterin converting factor small subunit
MYKTRNNNKRRRQLGNTKKKYYGGNSSVLNALSNAAGLVPQLAAKGIDSTVGVIAKVTGTNPNLGLGESVENLKNEVKAVADVVTHTDLGPELASELKGATKEILQPVLDTGSGIINEFAEKETKAVEGLVANVAEDVAYPIIAPIRTALSGVNVIENSVGALSEGTGLLKDQVRVFNDWKTKLGNLYSKIEEEAKKRASNMAEQTGQRVSNLANQATQQLEKKLADQSEQTIIPQKGGYSSQVIKRLQNEARQIGGRIQKSRLEFLSPHTMRSQKHKRKYSRLTRKHN